MPGTERFVSVLPLGPTNFDAEEGSDKTRQIQTGSVGQPGNDVQARQPEPLGSGRKRQPERGDCVVVDNPQSVDQATVGCGSNRQHRGLVERQHEHALKRLRHGPQRSSSSSGCTKRTLAAIC
jgi:hypothetical protein